ncbi:glycerophosphoryl diester phosphodiesterase membrane domain-containing protein [Oscillibacter hominis]|uniref:Glycerophosphoryl diester phosphodiesterase membrane domain-containing protein n=1 Tax=Oscillibacter hominis TaxID=2763056 RepID=A0A7G9B2Z2_9FIRM|nr:glycerophosphodiester phosphodiesterase family protein [Oscillibacter hominis]QNL43923.1 glycerophosphoryl diester phosphodiesterase membrane domain-containing protein [Oscillibacter hominis]
MKERIQTVWEMAFYNWSVLLCFEMLYRGAGFLLLFPLLRAILGSLPGLAGEAFLSQENLSRLFERPQALFALLGVAFLAGLFIFFELAALFLYCDRGWRREKLTVWGLWKETVLRTASLLHPRRVMALGVLPAMMLSVFAMESGYLRKVRIPEFLSEYIAGEPLLLCLFLLFILGTHLAAFFYLFGFPVLLLEGGSFPDSWRESLRLLRGRAWRSAGRVAGYALLSLTALWGAAAAAVSILALWLRFFMGTEAGREEFRAWLLSLGKAWPIAAGALFSTLLSAVVVMLFHQYRGDARPQWAALRPSGFVAARRTAAALGTLAALLLFSESEMGGRAWYTEGETAWVVAHRAGAAFGPENTSAALAGAIASGADMAEIDVRQLKDGTLVVVHDANFRRTAGVDLAVKDADYQRVEQLDAGSSFSTRFAGEPVPTLEELLQTAKGRIRLMIELKADGREDGLVEETLRLVEKWDMEDQCAIASTSLRHLKEVKKLCPNMATVYISAVLLSRAYDLEYVDAYSVETTALTRELVLQARYQGKQVFAWTANTERTIRKIIECGADGIVTDNPELARYCLNSMEETLLPDALCDLFFPVKSA